MDDPWDIECRTKYSKTSVPFAFLSTIATFLTFFLHFINRRLRQKKSSILLLHLTFVEFLNATIVFIVFTESFVANGKNPRWFSVGCRDALMRYGTRLLQLQSTLLICSIAIHRYLTLRASPSAIFSSHNYRLLVTGLWSFSGFSAVITILNDVIPVDGVEYNDPLILETIYVTVYTIVLLVVVSFWMHYLLTDTADIKRRKMRKYLKEGSPYRDMLFVLVLVLIMSMPDAVLLPVRARENVPNHERELLPSLLLMLLPRTLLPPLNFCCDVGLRFAGRSLLALFRNLVMTPTIPLPDHPHQRYEGKHITIIHR